MCRPLGPKVAGREPPLNGSRSNSFAQELFGSLPSRYDLLAEALSFGQNRRWRTKLAERLALRQPRRVLDVATGTAGHGSVPRLDNALIHLSAAVEKIG